MSIPATFPARRLPWLFRALLFIYFLALGLAPSVLLAMWPTGQEEVFFKSPVFLAMVAALGIACTAVMFLVSKRLVSIIVAYFLPTPAFFANAFYVFSDLDRCITMVCPFSNDRSEFQASMSSPMSDCTS
jgi:hypothetical protein